MTEESKRVERKYGVQITKPDDKDPDRITVLLPGTLLSLSEFASTRDVLLERRQLVIGFLRLNPLPVFGKSHEQMARDVAAVVNAVRALDEYKTLPSKYNIVGHSLGGKVALMVAAKYDIDNVNIVVGMDPVDDKPQELTAPKSNPRTNLKNSTATEIHLFQSELGGQGWFPQAPSDKNATVIKETYPAKITSLTLDKGAKHMSYKDTERDEASLAARKSVGDLIRSRIR